jgi:hypothetical protein
MKTSLLSILIGLVTAFVGCIFATFVAEVVLTAMSRDVMFVAGLVIYLCFVVVLCTCLIIKKLDKG